MAMNAVCVVLSNFRPIPAETRNVKVISEGLVSRGYREMKCRNDSVWGEYQKDRGRRGDEY